MAPRNVAVVNSKGEVINVIVVDDEEPDFDPGPGKSIVKDDKIGLGWKRKGNKFEPPPPARDPEEIELDTERADLIEKFQEGEATDADKDRLLALMLETP